MGRWKERGAFIESRVLVNTEIWIIMDFRCARWKWEVKEKLVNDKNEEWIEIRRYLN